MPLFTVLISLVKQSLAEVTVEQSPLGAVVKIDGQLFTEYIIQSGNKPILWPIIGPTGKPMTRAFPMENQTDEKKDHPHQRSMWFTHGAVNGIDFWTEGAGRGSIKHRDFVKLQSGKTGLIVTRNDWLAPDGKCQCEDQRTLIFGADAVSRWIDFCITIQALDKPVTLGDTKEGTFGLRVVEPLAVESHQGGRIINSNGQLNNDTWGKAASWVDYHGSIDCQTVGIAILNHPSSFHYPTFWHVRGYGLFAANPFGLREFSGDSQKDGTHSIQSGKSITLRYRVLFHLGDEKVGKIAQAFSNYSKQEE
ncbi:MAG TPA: PmoA family protein [Thermoguttaceae bacterium]